MDKLPYFPNILRFITEQAKILIIGLTTIVVILGIAAQVFQLQNNLQEAKLVEVQRLQLTKELQYWQDIARQYNNYRDAEFRIASLEYQLGEIPQAQRSLEKALVLDPNFQAGRALGDKIAAY